MVYFIDGVRYPGHRPRLADGEYRREPTKFTLNKMKSSMGEENFEKARVDITSGRFALVICAACPWACRALYVRSMLRLQDSIRVDVVSPYRDDEHGWNYATEADKPFVNSPICPTADTISGKGFKYLYEWYTATDPKYTGNVTTPLLIDRTTGKIVMNESHEIVRFLAQGTELYIDEKADEIDDLCQDIYKLNNGVYRAGMARSQSAFEEAVDGVFDCLNFLEAKLDKRRYLCSDEHPSLADVHALSSLLRFDDVYFTLFKCCRRRLKSYRNLSEYCCDLMQDDRFHLADECFDLDQIKHHYWKTFTSANPGGLVPKSSAAALFLTEPQDRAESFRREREVEGKGGGMGGVASVPSDAAARKAKGEFVRGQSGFRSFIGTAEHPAEEGRYVLVVANNCPWCHRVLLARGILGLEDVIGVDTVFYRRHPERGWQFLPDDDDLRDYERSQSDSLLSVVDKQDQTFGKRFVPDIYAEFGSKERSVPLLIDTKRRCIVNNESAEIVRMLGTAFRGFRNGVDLYPEGRRGEIERLNEDIYKNCNNGAYRAGFTSSQESYEQAHDVYFACLERLNNTLADRRFLTGNDSPTEADLRLFPTIVRHDPVYFVRMKLSKCMVRDLPHLHRWLQDMLSVDGVRKSTLLSHSLNGYFGRSGNNLVPSARDGTDSVWY